MRPARLLLAPALLVAALLAAGCGGGGATTSTHHETKTITIGQELMDLKKARESGAITEDEYQRLRESIIRKSTR